MVNKAKAVELREAGLTYQQIADEIGCSVDWCKRNLQDYGRLAAERPAVRRLIELSKKNGGITSADILKEVRNLYPNDFSKESKQEEERHVKRIRSKVKMDKDVIIRPKWLLPDQAKDIFYAILRKLQDRDERFQEDIDEIRQEFGLDHSYTNSIAYALLTMGDRGSIFLGRSVATEIDRLSDIVEVLDKRNKENMKVKVPQKIKPMSDFDDLADFMY